MNADFVAAVRPILQEVISGPPGTCATFEVSGDPDKWIQFTDGLLNSAYPYQDEPEARMAELLARPVIDELSGFEPGKFVTVSVRDASDPAVIEWMEDYFVNMLHCVCGEFDVDVRIDQL